MRSCGRSCYRLAALALLSCGACAGPLPRYVWNGGQEAVEVMAARDEGVRTFSTTCRILLKSEEGTVELTGVLIGQPPSRLRLRAWKFSQTVFDITMNDDGVFVFQREQEHHRSAAAGMGRLTRGGLLEVASLLPGFGTRSDWRFVSSSVDGSFVVTRQPGDTRTAVQCIIDKATLTTSRCTYHDESGDARQTLAFDSYRRVGDVVWPQHVAGAGKGASFELLFDRVEINIELPERAFVPPRRAVRQP